MRAVWKFFIIACALIFVRLQLGVDVGGTVLKEISSASPRSQPSLSAQGTVEETPGKPNKNNSKNRDNVSGLFIHVESWREGMTAWRKSLANLQVYAKKLNATLVEPGILNGRLVGDEGHLPLFDLMDQTKFDPDVSWMSLENFQQQLPESSTVTIHMCLDLCDPTLFQKRQCFPRKGPLACQLGTSSTILSDYKKKSSPRLQEALDLVAEGKLVVLKIHQLWKDGLLNMKVMIPLQENNGTRRTLPLHDGDEADRLRAQFDFQPRLYKKADIALQLLGIQQGQPFHAIHWRAELAKMNYTECAMRILTAQEQMLALSSKSNEAKFLLLSSLSTNRTRIWRGGDIYADESQTALSMLLHKGTNRFLKVDQVYDSLELRDPIESAATDLILAQRASQFATCTSTCSQNCLECNHAGSFALLAIGMRTKRNKSSHPCWPNQPKSAPSRAIL